MDNKIKEFNLENNEKAELELFKKHKMIYKDDQAKNNADQLI